ncbi:putative HTH-type transcriptional regulator YcgK [Cohnella xylanilytica]|uniref:LysR family transcriptional regulator n=1 Tax=Cohnella xylanilytica TaxID=557555 RepID=A0A841TY68_9BACL|nr:LysR family transcriptional regulator [Cohnella xylanilytica]MBB6690800.1 LysR family transcriptional regulator [Cohnella xylanilytica]GIO10925.1 putative HTH-type transcriptional regulator YcgK [Cohnella xylanilytica]
MEFRLLQYVIQIAAERNFSRAAEKLHIAQPSLSQQLSKLEKELGVLLFKRSTNSVELTHAGSVFVEKAQRIVDMTEQLRREMEDIADLRRGRIVIGSLPMTGAHVLPHVLTAFRSAYPDIELALVEETTTQLEQLTASGGTDVSLLSLPLVEPSLAYEPIIEEEIFLAVPPEHRLAAAAAGPSSRSVAIAELKDEPFVLLKKGQGFRAIAHELCAAAGFSPRAEFESSNIETVQSLVAAGMGIAFVPHMVARSPVNGHVPVYVRLKGRPTRTLVIAYRKGRYLSNAAEAFIATFRETMNKLDSAFPNGG